MHRRGRQSVGFQNGLDELALRRRPEAVDVTSMEQAQLNGIANFVVPGSKLAEADA